MEELSYRQAIEFRKQSIAAAENIVENLSAIHGLTKDELALLPYGIVIKMYINMIDSIAAYKKEP